MACYLFTCSFAQFKFFSHLTFSLFVFSFCASVLSCCTFTYLKEDGKYLYPLPSSSHYRREMLKTNQGSSIFLDVVKQKLITDTNSFTD